MQLLQTRRVLMNLTKNVLQTQAKFSPTAAANIQQKRQYTEKQKDEDKKEPVKLLTMPAFPLEETMEKFLKTCEPLLDKFEMSETKEMACSFMQNEGKELQALLKETAAKEQNWLAERWQRHAYFQYRDPVTVFSSPGMTFPLTKFRDIKEYAQYVAKVIYGLIKYKELIDNDGIPVVKMGKLPLDNSQFGKIFGTCRIPQENEDKLEYHPDSQHVAVIFKNHFYKLPVYNKECKPLHIDIIAGQLLDIMSAEENEGSAIGLLSTDHRDNWAKSYKTLMEDPENAKNVKTIQQSLFTVSLDKRVKVPEGENVLNVLSGQLIHGGGSALNSGNRWMDKTIQVIVNRSGMSGFCYEHSPAEGQPIALMCDYVANNLKKPEFFECGATDDCEPAEKLCLKSSKCIDAFIDKAIEKIDFLSCDLQMNVLQFKGYGKEFLKQQKLSPDSFIQMAMQLAFYKMHKKPAAQYESAHLRIYYNGRTETIRSCSVESVAFAKAITEKKESPECIADLLRKAVEAHRAYTNMALQGRGVDRHLLGLKWMAAENNLPIPEFYKSPGYVKSQYFRMSTSQVAALNECFMCYGPLVPDGYGCCYNPRKNDIIMAISSWRSNKKTDSIKFAAAMSNAFCAMQDVLVASSSAAGKSKL